MGSDICALCCVLLCISGMKGWGSGPDLLSRMMHAVCCKLYIAGLSCVAISLLYYLCCSQLMCCQVVV